jgi:signal transduction histidine kinase
MGSSARWWVALAAAGAALGLFAEWAVLRPGPLEGGPGPADYAFAAGDLLAGLVLVGGGALVSVSRTEIRIGPLLVASGLAWFGGTFGFSGIGAYAGVGSALATVHRGPLMHAMLTYPTGRAPGRITRLLVAAGYIAAVVEPVGQSDAFASVLAVAVLAGVARRVVAASGRERRARAAPLIAAAAFAGVVVAGAVVRIGGDTPGTARTLAWAYQATVAAIAAGLTLDLLLGGWTATTVARLVVDLGRRAQIGDLRERLAHALGDDSLEVGYWLREAAAYVDQAGRRLALPAVGGERVVTYLGDADAPLAVLVHDAAVVGDAELLESVRVAARLAISNARLRAEVRRQVDELAASRQRVVEAGDAQRRRIGQAVRQRVEPRLDAVRSLLEPSAGETAGAATAVLLAETRREIELAREELQAFAHGVHPKLLTDAGLAAALAERAARAPLPVDLQASGERFPAALESALYFVGSEALTNVAKHAHASRASIQLSQDGRTVVLAVSDDGSGGAELEAGSGLRGLADRVEALGGTLRIASPPGAGTRIVAELPLT